MADLSTTDPEPANPDGPSTSSPEPRDTQSPPGSLPDKDATTSQAQTKVPAAASDEAGLSIDQAEPEVDPADGELAVDIMLLLQTGARHPFRIDEKYLTKRNVTVTGLTETGKLDPFSITVYTLKELVLRDWRKEWDQPPREPSAIRLIHFGRMLEDRMPLSHYQFSTSTRNVVHMTVKPQEIIDEEEAAKKVKDSGSHRGRSGCCVIL
jgi:hypothetical protein